MKTAYQKALTWLNTNSRAVVAICSVVAVLSAWGFMQRIWSEVIAPFRTPAELAMHEREDSVDRAHSDSVQNNFANRLTYLDAKVDTVKRDNEYYLPIIARGLGVSVKRILTTR